MNDNLIGNSTNLEQIKLEDENHFRKFLEKELYEKGNLKHCDDTCNDVNK